MVSGYTLTAFPNAFILQQLQLKKQPTKQVRSMFKRGIRTVQNLLETFILTDRVSLHKNI